MHIRKAVITAAGRGVRMYPAVDTVQKSMLPIVDQDGLSKPVIQIIAEEALDSGIEEVCIVCAPGDEEQYRRQLESLRENLLRAYDEVDWAQQQAERISNLARRLSFAVQKTPEGYGHAVYCARDFVKAEPFLLLLGDHVYISNVQGQRCAQQLMDLAAAESCAVAAVHPTPEHLVGRYGTLSGRRVSDPAGVYQIEKIIEKPSVSLAELELHTPGLRQGHYLCFFGMHVLTPRIFDILEEMMRRTGAEQGEYQLTPALEQLARREKYLALEVKGSRYDVGARFGMLNAQVGLGLAGCDRHEMLTGIVERLAEANLRQWEQTNGA